jgi:hypothetical protein
MKIIKNIFKGIFIFIALLLIIAAFLPKKDTISSKIVINKPIAQVRSYLSLLKNQEQYSEWVKADTAKLPTITGVDGTVGATQNWDSKSGVGQQIITSLTDTRMEVDLVFIKPMASSAKAANIYKSLSDNSTELTSEFYSNDKYPFNLFYQVFGKKMIKETEEKNLQNIKKILEQQ